MDKINHKNTLSAAVSMFMTLAVCYSVSAQASDIDIYSNTTGGKTTITMMLDTSGSMSAVQMTDGSACELAPGTAYKIGEESSGTTPGYTKYYCGVDIPGSDFQRVYYYKRMGGFLNRTWFSCGASGSTNQDDCRSRIDDPNPNSSFENTTSSDPRYYYKNEKPQIKHYDRLTRLKDAIFSLMDSNRIDSNSVAIGIGQFSSQSGNDNVFTSADGTSGKILVPAALLSADQRTKIKNAVANLQGSGGTPTANAYAEVAAYMLGKNTTTSITGPSEDYIVNSSNNNQYMACNRRGLSCVGLASSYWTNGSPSGYTRQICSSISWLNGATTYCWVKNRTLNANENVYSGFNKSVNASQNGTNYLSPLSNTDTQCDGQGIYFLTDGNPNSSPAPEALMKAALGAQGTLFNVPATGTLPNGSESGNGMPAVGEFAKALRNKRTLATDPNRNPLGLEIKTAVVGFGSVFNVDRTADAARPVAQRIIRSLNYVNSKGERTTELRDYYNCSLITDVDARNACNWGAKSHPDLPASVGGYGEGGFYSAQSTDDVVQSVVKFLDDVKPEFDPVATGSPTLPQDALNPLRIQPYGYYASFIPKPQEAFRLWAGNLNKYHIHNGELYDTGKTIRLIKADGSMDSRANGIWVGGVKANLPLGIKLNIENEPFASRTIYTNRQITGTTAPYTASEANSLKKVNLSTLFGSDSTALFLNDPDKNYWLNVLGYDVGTTETGITLENLQSKQELRQVGAVMHSTPILLTQEGKITVNSAGEIDTTNRDDYLLFGSTQGLLHVVDADTGIEKFVFVPHEMMQNQKAAFLSEASTTGGAANLFYGIDAPWTAYSQYIAKADGTLTVNDSGRTVKESDDGDEIALKGLQWVYGGLRMGGRSYYALDLSDINTPSLKFHINPDAAVTATGTPDTNNALSYMGQSWSKPTIAYVKFGDTKKLVMFVGGGYDAKGATTACNASGDTVAKNIGYECAAYDQNTTTGSGAGVYMFDANTGDLLWWTSAYATAAKGAEAFTNASASTINMKYSVVSQINTIDRDNDGLADHLYFGDLRGQAFRVDLNNSATTKANFATRVVRLFDQHAAGGASPRFYEMPSISIHEDNGYVAAVAFSSGNRSSPLVGGSGTNQAGSTVSAVDGVFVVYDKDVVKSDLYDASPTLTTQNVTLASLNTNISTGVVINGNNGWKYTYSSTAGVYKGMNELYALDGMLYVNVYHRDGTGIGGNCGAGVKGDSYIYQFCLPTGKCSFSTTVSNTPNRVKIGAGILGSGIGQDLGGRNSKLVVPRPTSLDCTTTANKNKPECQQFNTAAKLQQLRWYETR